jgi:predicted hydrocarbon binding protein
MLKSAIVPKPFEPIFEKAEAYVTKMFSQIERLPEKGTLRVGGQRYLMLRAESLYLSWYDAMAETFGNEQARYFIYNIARVSGRSDSADFSKRLNVTDGIERLSSGPIHFAHAGWAFVEILDDSAPAMDDSYFLHYYHPNTFESEIMLQRKKKITECTCLFSAGYSAGWCSDAFNIEVHAREISCIARGDKHCEFIMAPQHKLDEYENRFRKQNQTR